MDDARRRKELKAFLRARREAIAPESVGLPTQGRRRTPGLRREELATIAGVSVTWYTWLEQGREIRAAADTMRRIARALKLTPIDENYLLSLAGAAPPQIRGEPPVVDAHLRAVVDGLASMPAILYAPNLDVLAFNLLADAIFDFDGYDGPFANNAAWRCFMDPKRQTLYEEWERASALAAATLRANHAAHLGDPAFEGLLAALRENSREFASFWDGGRTTLLERSEVSYLHPRLGRLSVVVVCFSMPFNTDYILAALPPADTGTARAFARFAQRPSSRAARNRNREGKR
jgi:transcriptional regulator with XRE-family HTH domain